MMLVPLIWISTAPTADQLLDRLTDKLKVGFSVDYTLKHTSFVGEIKGHYEFMPQLNAYFRAVGAGSDFVYIQKREGAIEIEHTLKHYYEVGPLDQIYTTGSRLSLLSIHAFPYLIARAAPRTAFADYGKFRYVKAEAVGGIPAHRIAAGTEKSGVDIWITEDGRVLRYVHNFTQDYEPAQTDFKFGPFGKPNPKVFTLSPPKGYRELALPRDPQPPLPGNKFNLTNWVDANGQLGSLPVKGNTLLIVTRKDCEITSRAKAMIAELSTKVPVIVLSDSGAPAGLEKYPLYRDVRKGTAERTYAQATPFYIAIDKDGVILGNWLGFNPKEANALKKEILEKFEG